MSLREDQCNKVCRILDNVLANRPTERDSLIVAVRKAFEAEPDIIRCKDCKCWVPGYITDNDDFIPPKCGEWQQMVGHSSDDYCSLAERREVQDENDKTTNNTTNA